MEGPDSPLFANLFIVALLVISMDKEVIQQTRAISREIVKKEFPEEQEHFDLLFDLTIQEIEELEPGKEEEFLEQIRAAHPDRVLGFTPYVIIYTFQVLIDPSCEPTEEVIRRRILEILKHENSKKIPGISEHLTDI